MLISILREFILLFMSLLCAVSSPLIGDFKAPFVSRDPENVKMRFASVSDVHLTDDFFKAGILELGLADMENAEERLDALVFCGDNTNHGYLEQYERFAETMEKYDPADNIIIGEGNHDTWTEEDGYVLAKEYFIEYVNRISGLEIDNCYYSTKVNGYTFIVMGSELDKTNAFISPEQLSWLDSEMEKASADGLPIFVVSHWPINETHGLPETWGDKEPEPDDGGFGDQSEEIFNILNKYKNVFLISGHLHTGFINETEAEIVGYGSYEKVGNINSINLPTFMNMSIRGRLMNGTGFVFEVYEDEVIVRGRSYTTSAWYNEYEFNIPLES